MGAYQAIKIKEVTCAIKQYVDIVGSWKKKHAHLSCFLYKNITKEHFVQLKTIDMMAGKATLSLKLPSTDL